MRPALRRWGPVIGIACLAWCGWLLADSLPSLGPALAGASWGLLSLAVMLSAAGAWVVFEAWRVLAAPILGVPVPRAAGAHIYFTAQILKYVPGRVWGFGYQAFAGSAMAPVSAWLLASIAHFALATLMLVTVAAVVIAFSLGSAWWAVSLVVAGASWLGAWVVVDRLPVRSILGLLARVRMGDLEDAWPRLVGTPARVRGIVMVLLAGGTVLGLLAWIPLAASSVFQLETRDALQLAAIYAFAWLAGYVAAFTPSGLGVRELVFVGLAARFPPDVVATMAVLGRINLLLADVALGAAFAWVRPRAAA
jgi:hypothetical protein